MKQLAVVLLVTCHRSLVTPALILLSFIATGFANAQTSAAPSPGSDQAAVIAAIQTMYAAFTTDDLAKFHSVAAPDYYAFDGGKRFDGDALIQLLKTAHASGKVYIWRVTKPEVKIEGNIAWITYVNEGSLKDASETKNLTWLESAVLRKENGGWRIKFFHSTRGDSR
jgi:ketosteroid isomerase-like protein